MYKIIRHYYGTPGPDGHLQSSKRTIKTGLTLEEAQAHCNDPETSSRTCTNPTPLRYTKKVGQWFDGYTET
jgi:hypothetical protein